MRIYIVEDQLFDLEDMSISLEKLGHEVIGSSGDSVEASEQILALKPELVIIDIYLNTKKTGIDLAKKLQKVSNIPYIFTSSNINEEVIIKATETLPVTYLTKPVKENDLKAAILLAETKNKDIVSRKLEELFIKSGNKLIKVVIGSILFIHTDTKNYCTIVTEEGRKLTVRNSISGLQQILSDDVFVQTHRSHIVNWQKIDSFHEADQTIHIQEHLIPVGRTFKSNIYKRLHII